MYNFRRYDIDTTHKSTFHVSHTLRQLPELVSVRVIPKQHALRGRGLEFKDVHFHAVGSVHNSHSKRSGGMNYNYDD